VLEISQIPKLIDKDLILFRNIIKDLFPSLSYPTVTLMKLSNAVSIIMNQR